MFRSIGKWLVRSLAIIGFFSILSTFAMLSVVGYLVNKETKLPEHAILELNFDQPLLPAPNRDPIAAILQPDLLDVFGVTSTIRKAAKDPRVKGLVADVSHAMVGPADAEEIHDALKDFKKAGKFTIAFADTFGEGGSALGRYYLASAFDEIWMQPSGSIPLIGVAAEVPFFKGSLDKLGIMPQFTRSSPWKTGPNMFLEKKFTPEQQQTIEQLLDSLFGQITSAIRSNRPVLAEAKHALFLNGPYAGEQAARLKLVDKLTYRDDVVRWAEEQIPLVQEANGTPAPVVEEGIPVVAGEETREGTNDIDEEDQVAEEGADEPSKRAALEEVLPVPNTRQWDEDENPWVPLAAYRLNTLAKKQKTDKKNTAAKDAQLALVFAAGQIMRGPTSDSGFDPAGTVYSEELAGALYQAANNEETKAVVLRVDSPGGSYVASDTIRRAALYVKSKGLPLMVSMGNVAASGGYFIAMDADKIFAEPSTVTGSIGVYGGKFVVAGLTDKLGVSWDTVQKGEKALMFSASQPMNEVSLQSFKASTAEVFADFGNKAKAARPTLKTEVPGLIGGRVFIGDPARKLGLIDEVGGLHQALIAAKVAAGYDAEQLLAINMYPKPEGLEAVLTDLLASPGGIMAGMRASIATKVLGRSDVQQLLAAGQRGGDTGLLARLVKQQAEQLNRQHGGEGDAAALWGGFTQQ